MLTVFNYYCMRERFVHCEPTATIRTASYTNCKIMEVLYRGDLGREYISIEILITNIVEDLVSMEWARAKLLNI